MLIASRLSQSVSQSVSQRSCADLKPPISTRSNENISLIYSSRNVVSTSFVSLGLLLVADFVMSHRRTVVCAVCQGKGRHAEDNMSQESGTDYRHVGRGEVRLQPLVHTEVTYLTSGVS